MRRSIVAALVALVVAASARARAQSFYAHAAELTAEGKPVAMLEGRVAIDTRLHFTSREVTISGTPTEGPAHRGPFISAGVGRDVVLRETGPWSISLLAGTWAPFLRADATGVQIALPSALPGQRGTIPPGTPEARGQPTRESAWDGPRRDASTTDVDPLAPYVSLRASPDVDAPTWATPSGARVRVVGRTAHDRIVEVEYHGIVVRGFADRGGPLYLVPHDVSASTTAIDIPALRTSTRLHGRAVALPMGTPLYATPQSTRPIGALSAPAVGLEPLLREPVTRCTAPPRRCVRDPGEPRGTARWIIQLPGALITAWVLIPAEELADHPQSTNRTLYEPVGPPSDWPRGG